MNTLGTLVLLARYARRAKVIRVAVVAVIGALQHQADIDYVEQLRRARGGLAPAEVP